MNTGNPDANGSNAGLPPELQAFFNSKTSQLQQASNGAQRAIPNRVIRGDGTEIDPSTKPRQVNAAPNENIQPQQRSTANNARPESQNRSAPTTSEQNAEPAPVLKDPFDFSDENKAPEPEKQAAPTSEIDVDLDSEEVPKEPDKIADNFKKFRKITKASKEAAAAAEKKAKELEEKLKEFNDGTFIPEVVQEKENEIARLSVYEKLHSLKTSKEYRQKFVEPLNQLGSQLENIAIDYEIPPETLEEALNITNRRELNQFLSSQGFDEAGASEVKSIFEKMRDLHGAARQAELQPAQVLKELQQEAQAMQAQETAQRNARISDQAKTAWVKALTKLRQEGKHQELIHRETDPAHNANVNRLLSAASSEFGKAVKALVANGLKELPEEIGEYFANMSIHGHTSVINALTRDSFAQEAERLEQQNREINQFIRPITTRGGTQGTPTSNGKEKPLTPKEAANEALRRSGVPV